MDVVFVDISFSIYAGWCTVASIVNVSAAGVACGARHLRELRITIQSTRPIADRARTVQVGRTMFCSLGLAGLL